MARSSRAFTRTPSLPLQHSPESFALQAGDDIANIRDVHCAYACLEKLIVPLHVNDCEEVYPTRSELGALIRLVNEELQRRIEAADSTISSLRGALCESDAP
jgi:hypothetical protein